MSLAKETCRPWRSDSPPVSGAEQEALCALVPDWRVGARNGVPALERTFTFANFAEALAYTNAVGALAEAADHHPEIVTEWGKVTVAWWTHAIGGLHRNDFIMAARCDAERAR